MQTEKYFKDIEKDVRKVYEIVEAARVKGLDPVDKVEVPLALSMAEKVVGLISIKYPQVIDSGIAERILDLEKEYGKLDPTVAFKIAEEVAKQKFCEFATLLEAIDAGIRVGFAYFTIGVVSPPLEGFTELKIGKTKEGKEYFVAYFSGPIRSAGTTAGCIALMIIDYLRELFGYARYDPSEEEVRRYVTENTDYHDRITNLQYFPLEEEMAFIAKYLPFQIAGEPTATLEVSNYKNLERVETNFVRGGMCLIFSEGLAQKAKKGFRLLGMAKKNGIKSTGFDWIPEYLELHEKLTSGKSKSGGEGAVYLKDLVAGRPIFGHPSRSGAFRFRYGRGRVSGFSASSLHPATMAITDSFIATGTQLKIEKPTKGCVVTPCDSIDGPIVKLFNGSVKKISTIEEAKKLYSDVEEIIYLGDFLFPFSDIVNRGADLIKPGYVEEWWNLELVKRGGSVADYYNVGFEEAVELSKKYGIPLHPKFIYYWTEISKEEFFNLIEWLKVSWISAGVSALLNTNSKENLHNEKLIFPFGKTDQEKFELGKRALELLGVEHEVTIENVVLNQETSKAILVNLGIDFDLSKESFLKEKINVGAFEKEFVLEIVNEMSDFVIKDKAGTFIGARMGRPEKAKLRKLQGSPNVLFPVGREGGRFRSVQAACEVGKVRSSFPLNYCDECKKETIYSTCEMCGKKSRKMYYFYEGKEKGFESVKEEYEKKGLNYYSRDVEVKHYFDKAVERLGLAKSEIPLLVKGVKGTSSAEHSIEILEKGILRAKNNLQVNKDGTIRFDCTELPIVSFKPIEIEVGVEKLKELGYDKDVYGKELVNEDQILELMPHDLLIPSSSLMKESGDKVFMNICNFIDEELEKIYGLKSFHNVKKRDDLIGQLGVFMAPHNVAGVVCRFIGFSNSLGVYASPYMHAAVRRDCVYPTTNFVYSEEGQIKNEPIGSYVEDLIKGGNKTKKIDSYGTIRVDINKEIYAFGVDPETKKLKKKRIKYFIKGAPPKKWVKIRTSSGRKQIMTPKHKFMYLDEKNNFKIKKASEIKKGDRIALLRNLNLDENLRQIFLPKFLVENVPLTEQKKIRIVGAHDFFKGVVKKNGKSKTISLLGECVLSKNPSDWYKVVPLNHVKRLIDNNLMKWEDLPETSKIRSIFNNKKWDLFFYVDEKLMGVLGYYSAEGYSRQNKTVSQICFRIMDGDQKRKLVSLIKDVFGIVPNLAENGTKITICNKIVYDLFKYCFDAGDKAYEKKVPSIVYNVSDDLVKSYLSAYFDGDGTIVYGSKNFVCFYSVSRKLLDGIALLGCRFGLFGRFTETKGRLPGKKVLERYLELGKPPKKHVLVHLTYSGRDFYKFVQILQPVNKRKLNIIKSIELKKTRERKIKFDYKLLTLEKLEDVFVDRIREVEFVKGGENSYCFDVESSCEEDKNVLWGEQIINFRCDGDESAIMLLTDVLLNFSRKFLPSHRGGTQDAPLVLNAKIDAGEVDDQILDFELSYGYPLELYELAEKREHSSKVKGIKMVKDVLREGGDPFVGVGFTHDIGNFNNSVICSAYKSLETMQDKVNHQMVLAEKLRAADTSDTARLIIERHFMRDMRGNLRKFSMQGFRCVECNEIMRRPPLSGVCSRCKGKIIFTIHEGGIKKYLEPAINLAEKYNLSPYLKQTLQITKDSIDSIFGKELEKQKALDEFF